jgi:hypothetical protein
MSVNLGTKNQGVEYRACFFYRDNYFKIVPHHGHLTGKTVAQPLTHHGINPLLAYDPIATEWVVSLLAIDLGLYTPGFGNLVLCQIFRR